MKRIVSLLLLAVVLTTFFACGKVEGDEGKQTTTTVVDGKNITLVTEVKPFEYEDYEDTFETRENLRSDGFKVTPDNAKGEIDYKNEALEIAKSEATVEYNRIAIYQDRTRGVWMVEFSDMTEVKEGNKINRTIDVKEVIFIDEAGYTLYAYTE